MIKTSLFKQVEMQIKRTAKYSTVSKNTIDMLKYPNNEITVNQIPYTNFPDSDTNYVFTNIDDFLTSIKNGFLGEPK